MTQGISSAMMYRAKLQSGIGIPFATDGVYLMNYLCNQQSAAKKSLGVFEKLLSRALSVTTVSYL